MAPSYRGGHTGEEKSFFGLTFECLGRQSISKQLGEFSRICFCHPTTRPPLSGLLFSCVCFSRLAISCFFFHSFYHGTHPTRFINQKGVGGGLKQRVFRKNMGGKTKRKRFG